LTHHHVPTPSHNDQSLTSQLEIGIVHGLVDVLISGGYLGRWQEVYEMILAKFGDRIKAISKVSLRLNQVLKEEITSSDLELQRPQPTIVFDPSGMEDIGGEPVLRQQADRVLCTTEMGLRRVVRQTKENRSCFDSVLLLKPKVALESVVDSMSKHYAAEPVVTIAA